MRVLASILVLLSSVLAPAQVQLALPFSSDMVLQRGGPIPVWGTAADGEGVVVQLNGSTATTTAANGQWRVELPTMPAGGPFTMSATGANNQVTLTNVMVGDVWICVGQSNMTFPLYRTVNGSQAVQNAASTGLRLLDIGGHWVPANATTAPWFSAVGFYFGRALAAHTGVPTGLIDASLSAAGIGTWQLNGAGFSLIQPLLGLSFCGMIWYQGETDATPQTAPNYEDDLRRVINDWRRVWGRGPFPFLLVQLANLPGAWRHWMEIRDAQLQVLDLPATAMTCIIDLPSAGVHPLLKLPVGQRLALAARRVAHLESIVHMGPILDPAATQVRAMDIAVGFTHIGGGLTAPSGALTDFEIAGANLEFTPAQATIVGDQVVVSAATVTNPVAVRYAWSAVPNATLFNAEGLPASPFRFLAHHTRYGAGCGPAPTPSLNGVGVPRRGRGFGLDLTAVPANQPGALMLGVSRSRWAGIPLPFALGPWGMPGCSLLVGNAIALEFITSASGTVSTSFRLPDESVLLGVAFYAQALAVSPGANPAGLVASNGASFRVGF